jgi:hypothetical protein
MRVAAFLLTFVVSLTSLVKGDAGREWAEIASRSPSNVIKLDEHTFDQLISADRNYTVIGTINSMYN